MRHDARHHYRVLYEMALEMKNKEAEDYLSGLIDQTIKRENERYCQNQTINALLQYYIGWAMDEGVRCEVQASCGELTVSPIDLSAILGNSIENAIHACRQTDGDRWLRVKIGIVGSAFAVQVENACGGVSLQSGVSPDDFLPAEAFRSENGVGGYGLKNIALAARRYGGDAQFRYDAAEHTFTTRVRINQ
jgi:sensor histidine kinase regulating citrate/malate metabolism